jgi:hypothetical protein
MLAVGDYLVIPSPDPSSHVLHHHGRPLRVTLEPGEPAALLRLEGEPDVPARWCLAALAPAPDRVAALAVEGQGWRQTYWQWPG